jgi:indole-3-glycerol phosphate synthase
MSTFLEQILDQKKREVAALYRDGLRVKSEKQDKVHTPQKVNLFADAISNVTRLSVIAEIKRASPSKGVINEQFDILARARAYTAGGAAAISVLTDGSYFHGSLADLKLVRQNVAIPILRKDFIIDPIQIDESSLAGANAILLIAAALTYDKLAMLSTYAKSRGLDVLIEIHSQDEVEVALHAEPSVLGINNRDLHTFKVSLDTTINILQTLPRVCPIISESGFVTATDIRQIAMHGVDGILVGESLMRKTTQSEIRSTIAEFSTFSLTSSESGCRQ